MLTYLRYLTLIEKFFVIELASCHSVYFRDSSSFPILALKCIAVLALYQ